MKNFFYAIIAMMLLVPVVAMAQDGQVDVSDPTSIVEYLTTFIVLGVTALVKLIAPKMNGVITLVVVSALSLGIPFVTDLAANTDLSYMAQVGLGLASVFLHQLKRQISN